MNAITTIKLLLLTPPSEGQGEAYNAIKVPQWYSVQEGDATMMLIASLPGQKFFLTFLSLVQYITFTCNRAAGFQDFHNSISVRVQINASYNTSMVCNAFLPVPSFIWWRQLVPGAAIITSVLWFLTAGNKTNSPIFMERS